MIFPIHRDEEARIFQTQLAALLEGGVAVEEAVKRIELKADPGLGAMVRAAMGGGPLVDGLVRERLLHPDLAGLSGNAFRAHLAKEARSSLVEQQVRRHIGRVFWFLGLMTAFALFVYGYFELHVLPMFADARENTYGMGPDSLVSHAAIAAIVMFFALAAMASFMGFLAVFFLATRMESARQWRQFRALWKIPGLAGLFRKQVTWRVFTRFQFLLGAGEGAAEAMSEVLGPFGLKPALRDGVAQFPHTTLLDSAAVRAVNLGASLDTLPRQLEISLDALQYDLPVAAQNAARVVFYAGYLLLGVLVGSMLVQMYEPIFSLANVI